jgi:hypothetical protein
MPMPNAKLVTLKFLDPLTDEPLSPDISLPDVLCVQRGEFEEVKLFRSWYGTQTGYLHDGHPTTSFSVPWLALRGRDIKLPEDSWSIRAMVEYIRESMPAYVDPPWIDVPYGM